MVVLRQGDMTFIANCSLTHPHVPQQEHLAHRLQRVPDGVLRMPLQYQFFVHGLVAALLVGSLWTPWRIHRAAPDELYRPRAVARCSAAVVSHLLGLNVYVGAGLWGFARGADPPLDRQA
jgi:hypothetical protein